MKHAVRVCGIAWSGKHNERAYRGRRALERQLVKEIFVYVCMKGWVVFQQVLSPAFDCHCFRTLELQADAHINRYGRANLDVLRMCSESGAFNLKVIRIEGH